MHRSLFRSISFFVIRDFIKCNYIYKSPLELWENSLQTLRDIRSLLTLGIQIRQNYSSNARVNAYKCI